MPCSRTKKNDTPTFHFFTSLTHAASSAPPIIPITHRAWMTPGNQQSSVSSRLRSTTEHGAPRSATPTGGRSTAQSTEMQVRATEASGEGRGRGGGGGGGGGGGRYCCCCCPPGGGY